MAGGTNETLSMRQAESIGERVNEIMADCKSKMDAKSAEFVNTVSSEWEDENAKKFAEAYKKSFDSFMDELDKNNKTFFGVLKDIADGYAKLGNIGKRFSKSATPVKANINVSSIKDAFADGSFGMMHVETGGEVVSKALEEYEKAVSKIASETVAKLKSINAFGNPSVQNNVAKSGGKLIEILEGHVKETRLECNECIDKTKAAFKKFGQAAAESSGKLANSAPKH